MNIEKEIYKALISNSGGVLNKVEDLTTPTLRMLKKGEGKTSVFKVFELLFKNGIETITLKGAHNEITFNSRDREIISRKC